MPKKHVDILKNAFYILQIVKHVFKELADCGTDESSKPRQSDNKNQKTPSNLQSLLR